jgi:hypothetical protein
MTKGKNTHGSIEGTTQTSQNHCYPTLRLDDEAKTKLAKYAEFLDCSPSYVVMEALKLVYNKDKEFQAWLSGEHTSNHLPSSKGESFQLELK